MSAIFGETLVIEQENGLEIELVVWGDEFYVRYETKADVRPDGRTSVFGVTFQWADVALPSGLFEKIPWLIANSP